MIEVSLQLPIRLAVIEVDAIVDPAGDHAAESLEACAERYRVESAAHGRTSPGSIPGVETARSLFRALRIDPTRHRPCSEALLKRAIKGLAQPRIGALVDVGNWCALDFLLPLGVYDRRRIEGTVVLREGVAGESYLAISGREINLGGRYVLADAAGPFGSPITDSRRTAVSKETRTAAIIVYAPPENPAEQLRSVATIIGERVVECCGGRVTQCEVHAGDAGG